MPAGVVRSEPHPGEGLGAGRLLVQGRARQAPLPVRAAAAGNLLLVLQRRLSRLQRGRRQELCQILSSPMIVPQSCRRWLSSLGNPWHALFASALLRQVGSSFLYSCFDREEVSTSAFQPMLNSIEVCLIYLKCCKAYTAFCHHPTFPVSSTLHIYCNRHHYRRPHPRHN